MKWLLQTYPVLFCVLLESFCIPHMYWPVTGISYACHVFRIHCQNMTFRNDSLKLCVQETRQLHADVRFSCVHVCGCVCTIFLRFILM